MGKENLVSGSAGNLPGRPITRARASALRASGQIPVGEVPPREDQKRVSRGSTKRTALEEKKGNVHKKRAVLRDVTNVCCESSYESCFNAVKLQANDSKQVKRGRASSSKVAPYVAARVPQFQAGPKAETSEETVTADAKMEDASNTVGHLFLSLCTAKDSTSSDNFLGSRSSALPPRPRGPSRKVEKVSVTGSAVPSDDPKFIDIDSDKKDPQLCSLYASEIYYNLRAAELARRPSPDFMERVQKDITQSMRGILVDWLVEVSEEYKLVPDTLYLTVYLIDWFLYRNCIERQRLQLLGITCMLIASKYEEICAPRIEEFCFITDNTYTREEVLKMESEVLKCFGFQIYAPTSKTFLRRFLRAAQASYTSSSLELEYLANYLVELSLMDYDFLKFLPSITAASAIFLAKWTFDQSSHPWNPTLEHYTSYKASDLKASVLALQDLQLNTSGCPLNAIRMKYRQEKFKSVASLTSQKLLDTLF